MSVALTGISPAAGGTSGGTPVTITGRNFAAGATVTIGGVPATQVTVASESFITAVTGARAAGAVDVVVALNGESATLGSAFTYVAPVAGANSPPVIQTVTARGARPNQPPAFADLNEVITVTATATDAETPGSLIYEWSAPAGTFTGSGAAVSWRAPQSFATPGTVTLSVTVVDRYTAPGPGGTVVQHEHRVSAQVSVRVHDSAKEVGDMARRFLLLFSDSSVAPEVVVQDFLPGCGAGGTGREDELSQVISHRQNYWINSYEVGQPTVTVNFNGVCPFRNRRADACARMTVDWRDTYLPTGETGRAWGIDHVTAIYNGTRWGLCDSDFESGAGVAATMTGRYFKP